MTSLSKKEVKHIANLAQLPLTEQEEEIFAEQLSETLEYVEKLNELLTEKVLPTFQTSGLTNVTREDIVKPSLSQEEALKNAKGTYRGYFKVKAVLES